MPGDVRLGAAELVRFQHVGCSYGSAAVIEDVSFTVTEGGFVGIVGPSGGGKTTVLRAMLGTVDPVYGRVTRRGDVRLGYVPQVEAVDWSFPITVREVVHMTMTRPRFGRLSARNTKRAAHVLERLGIEQYGCRQI